MLNIDVLWVMASNLKLSLIGD